MHRGLMRPYIMGLCAHTPWAYAPMRYEPMCPRFTARICKSGHKVKDTSEMKKRTYRPAVRIVLLYTVCAAVVALIISSAVFESTKNTIWAAAAACAAFGLYLFLFIIPSLVTFELNDENLLLKTPGKRQVFPLASTFFSAESCKSGSYKECTLYIGRLDTEGYITEGRFVFCTLLGMPCFNALITDLGVKGAAAPKKKSCSPRRRTGLKNFGIIRMQ